MAKILIVDDRAINREYLCSLLQHFNHETIEVTNGVEALSSLEKTIPDLIISDIYMPIMDGYEFVRQLKQKVRYKNIPVIFYTAIYRKEEADEQQKTLDVHCILTKPCDPLLIIDTVNQVLAASFNAKQREENPQEQRYLNPSIYRAPQNLVDIGVELGEQISQLNQAKQSAGLSRDKIMTIADALSEGLLLYQKVSTRLFTLIELFLDMIEEQIPVNLLKLYCLGANKVIDTELAIAGIFDNQGNIKYLTSSCQNSTLLELDATKITKDHPFIDYILKTGSAFFMNSIDTNVLEIPYYISPPKNMLGISLLTTRKTYGFAYFINKNTESKFSQEDSQVISSLSAALSLLYENKITKVMLQNQSRKLQIEGAKLKIAKERLHKSEIMFRQFAESIKDVFWRTSSNINDLIYVSPAYEEIFGVSNQLIIQDPYSWQQLIVDEDRVAVKNHIRSVVKNQTNGQVQYRIRKKDGTIRHIYNKTFCLRNEKGIVVNYIGIATDITEYLHNQQNIMLEQNLRRIFDRSNTFAKAAPKLIQFVCNLFQWEVGEIWLIDEKENMLRNVMTRHSKGIRNLNSSFSRETYSKGEGFLGKLWQSPTTIYIKNVSQNADFKNLDLIKQFNLEAALGFPLTYKGKVMGVMIFLSQSITHSVRDFSDILDMLGARVGEYIYQKYSQDKLLFLAKQRMGHILF
ncbi:MAG: response regulator [Proteobacteria bacterium]|nr:response regulator [Pseudomonadota bacterium]